MNLLVEYKAPCTREVLSSYGSVKYSSKTSNFILLETDNSIEQIKEIDGIITVYKERKGKL